MSRHPPTICGGDRKSTRLNSSHTVISTRSLHDALPISTEVAATEHRQAYGTAKTENLRDSGLWRIILPAFVALLCIALLAVPLIILIPLFVRSLDVTAPTHNLWWRSEEHTSELQSHSDLHSFPTRRSSDLNRSSSHRTPSGLRYSQNRKFA